MTPTAPAVTVRAMRRITTGTSAIAMALVAAGLSSAQSPPAAAPATIRIDGARIVVTGTPGRQVVSVTQQPGQVAAAGVVPGPGCSPAGENLAFCTAAGITSVTVDLGAGDDDLLMDAVRPAAGGEVPLRPGPVLLGDGDDRVIANVAGPVVDLGAGDDLLTVREGTGTVPSGTPANGPDDRPLVVFRATGGAGRDALKAESINERSWKATLDAQADDGFAGMPAHHYAPTFESVAGGPGADTISGAAVTATLQITGGEGDDELAGGRGDDRFIAEPGADAVQGKGGSDAISYASAPSGVSVLLDGKANDGTAEEKDDVAADVERITGSPQADVLRAPAKLPARRHYVLRGLGGGDVLKGGPYADKLDGGHGRDAIDARGGGTDSILCGADKDEVQADRVDRISSGCESRSSRS